MFFGGNYFDGLLPSRKWIVWDKGEQFYRRTFAECELCYCNFDGNTRIIKCGNEFVAGKQIRLHPTQKPVAVMRFCIDELPKGCGNIICDPYMGSGTTGVAALQNNRRFIGIEKERQYFETACQRIQQALLDVRRQTADGSREETK
jgi:DNA modification methylase